MEQLSSRPTGWSLEDRLVFSCFVFLLVAMAHEIPQFFRIPSPLLSRGLCKGCFLYLECSAPSLYLSSLGNPPLPDPPDVVSFLVLLLAVCLHVPQSPVNSLRACPSSYPQGLAYCGFVI